MYNTLQVVKKHTFLKSLINSKWYVYPHFCNRLEWRYQLFASGGSYVEHSVGPSPCPMFDLLHSTQVCISILYCLCICLVFYVSLENISLITRRYHWRWRYAKFMHMREIFFLWIRRDRVTPAVLRCFFFFTIISITESN